MKGYILFFITALFGYIRLVISTPPAERCIVELTRLFGIGPRNSYALVCKCQPTVAKSLVFENGPSKELDTVGRNNATVDCFEEHHRNLTSMCNRLNSTEFARRADPVLNHCVNRTVLNEKEAKDTAPFNFDKSNCKSKLAWSSGPNAVVAWVCECPQSDFYEVTPGWVRYLIDGNETEVAHELDSMKSCASEATEQMQTVCKNSPGNFDVSGLQILQTCCKRVHANSETKFDCEKVVPEDLSNMKFEL